MKKNKWVSLLLAAVMMLSMLAACGNTTSTNSTAPSTNSTAPSGNNDNNTPAPAVSFDPDAESYDKAGAIFAAGISGDADQLTHEMVMPTSSSKDTLNVQISSDPGSLDPYTTGGGVQAEVAYQNVCESLIDYGYDYQLVPVLAERWEDVDDTHHIFYLRQGVKFTSGKEFTAECVKWAIEMCKAHPQKQQWVKTIDIDNIKIIDDYTIEIPTTEPDAYFMSTLRSVKICHPDDYTAEGFAEKPIGTGPYVVDEFVGGSYVVLKANEDYWGGAPAIKTVNIKVISDAAQRSIALETGEVDLVMELAETDYSRIEADDRFYSIIRPGFKSDSFYFNTTDNSIFGDVRVRQAVAYAIDKAAIFAAVYQGKFGSISTAFPSSGMIDYNPDWENSYYNYDLEKAKSLLADAGIPEGTEIRIINDGNKAASTCCEIVQQMLNEIGLKASITSYEKAVYNSVVDDATQWDMATVNFTAPSGYTADMAFAYFAWEGINRTQLQNSELNDLVHEATTIVSDAERAEVTNRIVEILHAEVPGYAYHRQAIIWAWSKDLKGFNVWGQGSLRYQWMYFG